MKKEIILTAVKAAGVVIESAAIGVGVGIAYSGIAKHYGYLGRASKLAKLEEKKKGETVEIFIYDKGIPLVVKEYALDIAVYIVVDIKKNGKYKMRYVGSRSFTQEELIKRYK